MKKPILAVLMVLATASLAAAQTVLIVRHAERADAARTEPGSGAEPRQEMMASDPELSTAGRARAEALASILKDAGVTEIFATEYKRTQQTAAPLAKQLAVAVQTVPANDTAALVGRLKSAKGNVLVVGHSNTVPDIIKGLGIGTPVAIAEADYDNLFVVTPGPKPALVRLHFR